VTAEVRLQSRRVPRATCSAICSAVCRAICRGRLQAALILALIAGSLDASGQSPPDFTELRRIAATLPRLHSLAVSHRGETVFEYYAKGHSANRGANVKSASKSIISALTGIAIERGLIKSVDQQAADFFPELARDKDPRKRTITVEQLLTMRSGLESTSGQNYGRWVTSRNWVTHALARPLVADPGTTMQYSTGTSHILSALLTRVTKLSTWQFANAALGKPLGIQIARWPQDPQGIYFGGNDMLLTPRQMVAFGELYLNEGRVKGQQVVPERWVRTSCVPRTSSRFDPGREYGYGWWIDEVGGETACYAWGYGGQFILVFDELDLVVTATSSVAESDERRGYRRELLRTIGEQIVQPLAP
jgi:CubicO group peptidase (beta-lactamase class C family)